MAENTSKILYFAYGSNMLSRRLRYRTPSARMVASGFVLGRRLTFHKVSVDGSGKCDIPNGLNDKDRVYGVLFEIDSREKWALDYVEGVGQGYREDRVDVVIHSNNKSAMTYVATRTDRALKPYHWYKEFVLAGALEHALPASYIEWLRSIDAESDPDEQRCARNSGILG